MIRRLLLALTTVTTLFATPLAATDIGALSSDERAAFRDEVRAYLLENPEVLMEAIAVLERRQAAETVANDATLVAVNAKALFEDGFSHVAGNPDGDITIVEFMDYRCGYCRKAFPEVESLIESDGNIRFIIKELPILGDESLLAARFAISTQILLGEEAYKQVHDALMTMRGNVTEASLSALAGGLGLDSDAILAGMRDPRILEIITANHELAQRMQISGTPTFVMKDQLLRGYVPLDGMKQILAEIRAASDG